MATYRKRSIEIEAVQWSGVNANEVCDFADDRVHIYNGCMFVDTYEGQVIANRGDYICKGDSGYYFVCNSEHFDELYELVEE